MFSCCPNYTILLPDKNISRIRISPRRVFFLLLLLLFFVFFLLMTTSKGRGAQNQLVATQCSVVDSYASDHVTHLMTNQWSDMWYLHNEHVPEN